MAEQSHSRRSDFRITSLAQTAGGHWRARVSVNGDTFDVNDVHGSWELLSHDADGKPRYRHVLPHVAAALQTRARREERRLARA